MFDIRGMGAAITAALSTTTAVVSRTFEGMLKAALNKRPTTFQLRSMMQGRMRKNRGGAWASPAQFQNQHWNNPFHKSIKRVRAVRYEDF